MPKSFDLVRATKQMRGELLPLFMDLRQWRTFKSRYRLDWNKLHFSKASHSQVPKERGIYAFTAEVADGKLPAHGYILYMGIAGDTSNATLHSRYSQYLRQATTGIGRARVNYMLGNWMGELFFNFVPLPNPAVSLARIEGNFLNAVRPPVNYADFSAEVSAARKALMN